MHSVIVFGLVIVMQYIAAEAGSCLYDVDGVQICSGERKIGNNINIYHSLNVPYDTTCSCTVTGVIEVTLRMESTNVPGCLTCGTTFYIMKPDGFGYNFTCSKQLEEFFFNIFLKDKEMLKVIVRTESNITSSCVFCLNFVGIESNITVNCGVSQSTTSPEAIAPEQTNTESVSSAPSPQKVTDTATSTTSVLSTPFSSYSTKTLIPETTRDDTKSQSSSTVSTVTCDGNLMPLEVIIPVGFGGFGFGVLMTLGAVCFIFRRKTNGNKEEVHLENENAITHAYDELEMGNNTENAYEQFQNTESAAYENNAL